MVVIFLEPVLYPFRLSPEAKGCESRQYWSRFNLPCQVFDILWSDPQPSEGCIPNALRGAGTYFGPDVTRRFLKRNKMMYIVRSHECKPEGYELNHNNKVSRVRSLRWFKAPSRTLFGTGAFIRVLAEIKEEGDETNLCSMEYRGIVWLWWNCERNN